MISESEERRPPWLAADSGRRPSAFLSVYLVAASEHGFVAAQNPHVRILDLVGLHDPVIAHRGLHRGYLKRRAPSLIWLPDWHYVALRREILHSRYFQRQYIYFPSALSYGVAVRRDRPDLVELVRAELASFYRRRGE